MRTGVLPSLLAALLMAVAALRYAANHDLVGAVIAVIGVVLAVLAAAESGSSARRHPGNGSS